MSFLRANFNRLCYLTGAYTLGHPMYVYYCERKNRYGNEPDYSNEKRIRDEYNPNGRKWAIVTGASEGIGRCFAIDLAEHGFNVVLASRTESKL